MEQYLETPDTRWDRAICIGVTVAAVGGLGWLLWRITGQPDQGHPAEFIAAALLLGLALYFGWLIYALSTLRYLLADGRLVLHQAWSHAEVRLTPDTHLYRWRHRWSWDGGAQRDLHVEALRLFPPFWVWREDEIWVLLANGQATAFRPSARLLAAVKAQLRQGGSLAG